MKKLLILILLLLAAPAVAQQAPHWQPAEARQLIAWLESAEADALEPVAAEADTVRAALAVGDAARLDAVATAAAWRLLGAYRGQCCGPARPPAWDIEGPAPYADQAAAIRTALEWNGLDRLFRTARPSHPHYAALRRAHAAETDPARRRILAVNLARWRWMPRDLGERYLLVNAAAYEATLWEEGRQVGRWRAIVGRLRTPTPVFEARVSGVVLNPWWEIPSSIAAEGIGAMVRNRPAEARRRGYVLQNGRYRQRPGPGNALGRMKLVMPNAYSVFLHDTSNRSLFEREDRALSHGCVRIDDALGFAATLLSTRPDWDRERVDRVVEAGVTATVDLAQPIPVYIAYFTAAPDATGAIRYYTDLYGRDAGVARELASGGSDLSECAPV
ncbi:MAG: L,D-transpeptidase family protein [Parasphingopyxis sp.]